MLLLTQGSFAQDLSNNSSKLSVNKDKIESETSTEVKDDPSSSVESIYVFGSKDKTFMTPGSAQFVPKEEVKKLDYTDPTRALQTVPGVYIQEEDGLGLRANIGLRGATPHRSKKITLMEDGVLIGPAPYSAPAAYFFPNLLKTEAIEVFKGFSSVVYGPNSIGGAVNFTTTQIGERQENTAEVTIGRVRKYRALSTGPLSKKWSYLLDVSRLDSSGIKTLPDGDRTGFYKNDVLFKTRYKINKKQSLSIKTSFSEENSRETYLGLSEADFATSPYSRYAASANDRLEWKHQQFQLRHQWQANNSVKVNSVAYYHQFDRLWSKLDRFRDGSTLNDNINPNSDEYEEHYGEILKGNDDSLLSSGDDYLYIGNNDRTYYSSGLQIAGEVVNSFGPGTLQTNTGVRLHQDRITRNHTRDTVKMIDGKLESASDEFAQEVVQNGQNRDRARAFTYFLKQEYDFANGWLLNWGGRYEYIDTRRINFGDNNARTNNFQEVWAPGVGIQYSPHARVNLIAGINQGRSAVAPGQDSTIRPEKSTNYELGAKYNGPSLRGEVIGFFSDYQNIKGFCSFSTGCENEDIDKEFNGGQAKIYGLETSISSDFSAGSVQLPVSLTYTYTIAQFADNLESDNSEWGIGLIRDGDPLPYIPQNKISLSAGANYKKFASAVRYNWQSKVFDQSASENRKVVDGFSFVDVITKYKYSRKSEILMSVDNLFANDYVVSLRPFGARPGKPRSVNIGFRHAF